MEAFARQRFTVGGHIAEIDRYKRRDLRTEDDRKLLLVGNGLPIQEDDGPAELKVGFLYEIDHKLPPKTPLQLEGIRAAMVTEVNELNVTVKSPSILALRTFFCGMNFQKNHPELDRRFTMPSKLAKEILIRQMSYEEFVNQKHLQQFWLLPHKLLPSKTANPPPATNNVPLKNEYLVKSSPVKGNTPPVATDTDSKNETSAEGHIPPATSIEDPEKETVAKGSSAKGLCWTELNSPKFLRWGNTKKISYSTHKEKALQPQVPSLSTFIKQEVDSDIDIKPDDEAKRMVLKRKREDSPEDIKPDIATMQLVIKGKEEDCPTELKPLVKRKCKSRKGRFQAQRQNKMLTAAKLDVKKTGREICKLKQKVSFGWWSQDRYKLAEVRMFAIMKAKGAVLGSPILRQALRLEARKQIGDTGLLDHVLKHMSDKVSPSGEHRFRRRHNADGAMEYWLESADLVNIRRQAGIKDPYWSPPPGWKPGDNPADDPNWARELKILKEDILRIKKDLQELHRLREEEVDRAIVISAKSSSGSCYLELDTNVISLREDYENLVKRKARLQQQLSHIKKRKPEDQKHNERRKDARYGKKKPTSKISEQKMKLSYNRWSSERYKGAEVKMLEVMKKKGAVAGKPMLRQALRLEVRKHVGDTGLLDHILKHMADKVAPNGLDRFRRRHNSDGAMEYWLESADLVNIRKQAGVKDPYWTPPLGWKPGDNPLQDPNYARELQLLKEEMFNIEKDMQDLLLSKRVEADKAMAISSKSSSESCSLESDTTVVSFEEDYDNPMQRIELQQAQITESLNGMQDSILVGNNFHIPHHDAMASSGIHQSEQGGNITSFLMGPHGSAPIELNNFLRLLPVNH